jgi:hypothetical protein
VSAQHRDNPLTRETVWRVYQLPEELRSAVRQRRQALGQTQREFLAYAIETELPGLLAVLREQLPAAAGQERPARLPLTEPLLEALRSAGAETGLPAARLLLACLGRAARRKRRRRGSGSAASQNAAGGRQRRSRREKPPGAPASPVEAGKTGAANPSAPVGGEGSLPLVGGPCSRAEGDGRS